MARSRDSGRVHVQSRLAAAACISCKRSVFSEGSDSVMVILLITHSRSEASNLSNCNDQVRSLGIHTLWTFQAAARLSRAVGVCTFSPETHLLNIHVIFISLAAEIYVLCLSWLSNLSTIASFTVLAFMLVRHSSPQSLR